MYPDLFGIPGFTQSVLIVIGALLGCLVTFLYLRKLSLSKSAYIDLTIVVIVTFISAFVFATLFENLYEAIKHAALGESQKWTWSQTFYGGLFGGVVAFLLMYKYFYLRNNEPILTNILVVAPGSISLGHAIGRLGCFLNGCCYGKETDKWYGVLFPGFSHKVVPIQLFEMFFLLILSGILIFLAFKWSCKFTVPIYLISYGLFRFVIEFFRGDERGQFGLFSPSQYWSILLFGFGLLILTFYFKEKPNKEEKQ